MKIVYFFGYSMRFNISYVLRENFGLSNDETFWITHPVVSIQGEFLRQRSCTYSSYQTKNINSNFHFRRIYEIFGQYGKIFWSPKNF